MSHNKKTFNCNYLNQFNHLNYHFSKCRANFAISNSQSVETTRSKRVVLSKKRMKNLTNATNVLKSTQSLQKLSHTTFSCLAIRLENIELLV